MKTRVSLQELNTLAVPSVAAHYSRVSSKAELGIALRTAAEQQLPVLILGGGSNVILPPCFPGLVIHMAITGFQVIEEDAQHVWLRVGAGVVWQDLVEFCLSQGYQGLENLSLIPGTVGAAPIQNIGAYGVELNRVFHSLTAVHQQTLREEQFDREACEFSYRDSVFKNRLKDQYVITDVTLKLNKQPQLVVEYAPLKEALAQFAGGDIDARRVSEIVCAIRRSKLPDPGQIPNAGSFFKNPIVPLDQFRLLQRTYPDIAHFPVDETHVKLAAAWLLDEAGWKGHSDDGIGMHSKQALVLTNPGRRSGADIIAYGEKIQSDIKRRFGVDLEREPIAYFSTPCN